MTKKKRNRLIASFNGNERGPLLICLAGIHGNEPAGVEAVKMVGKMLEVEPITKPDFVYRGKFIGVIGNLPALKKKKRFIDKDLNRSFTRENIEKIKSNDLASFDQEDKQVAKIILLIQEQIDLYHPDQLYVLDLHTTTATGGIFSIVADQDPESIKLAVELHAPVILGMTKGIKGTTVDFFEAEQFGVKTTCVAFEAGQHKDPLSINRSIAAIINCMRSIGSVNKEVVENLHDHLLISYSKGLPKVAELEYCYKVQEDEEFRMERGFKNFQKVRQGQILAKNKFGDIKSDRDGLVLMPKYQTQGNDGFFIVTPH